MEYISVSKINEICNVVKECPDSLVRVMASAILENLNTLDIKLLNEMFVSMMRQIAITN